MKRNAEFIGEDKRWASRRQGCWRRGAQHSKWSMRIRLTRVSVQPKCATCRALVGWPFGPLDARHVAGCDLLMTRPNDILTRGDF